MKSKIDVKKIIRSLPVDAMKNIIYPGMWVYGIGPSVVRQGWPKDKLDAVMVDFVGVDNEIQFHDGHCMETVDGKDVYVNKEDWLRSIENK